ncbi:lipoprotein [Spiroplasma alleghenense]|uniref:Lipoprotein n=1 Tax=Spiroplasma alleghenense TaxID=216931 RepID=A0A345Z3Q5_9MOLU|nr:lipoprotein [Spiroplasma alleghenense]AXK51234.1 hypothetical protein SALLE_v1c05600 [Spiroplasma alleghenense]
MKKLLGLLAAFSLTASAGSAVVACGGDTVKQATADVRVTYKPKNAEDKDKIEKIIKETKMEFEIPKLKEDKHNQVAVEGFVDDKLESNKELDALLEYFEIEDTEYKLEDGEFDVTVTAKYTIGKFDLKMFTADNFDLGELADAKPETIKAQIDKLFKEIIPFAYFSEDYLKEIEVTDVKDGVATVKATKNSKLVQGEGKVSFTVKESGTVDPEPQPEPQPEPEPEGQE